MDARPAAAVVYTGNELKLFIRVRARTSPRSTAMIWETPTFVEVKMDAEINSYQDDFGDGREPGV
jgi:hypothetical protein